LGEVPLQRRRFRITDAARKTKPQGSHAPLAKTNSTTESTSSEQILNLDVLDWDSIY
jgi:hypothetical protein